MQNFTFITKQVKLLNFEQEMFADAGVQSQNTGFWYLRDMYKDDPDFKEAYEASENTILRDRSQWTKYMI